MINSLRNAGRLNEFLLLSVSTAFCFSLSIFRVMMTQSEVFLFLNWNLFLAGVPWFLSTIYLIYPNIRKFKMAFPALICSWLLFFPNAPYILTDLFHLRISSGAPIWFDLILILSFAWTGLLFGFLSLRNIEYLLFLKVGRISTHLVIVILLFLSSFGIYIGRYLRWNSWDIISNPFGLMYDVLIRFIDPFSHPRTWGMTILMGLFLNMVYFGMGVLKPRTESRKPD